MLTLPLYSVKEWPQETLQGLLASIIESSEDAIISLTLDGVITSWNPGAQQLFGYTPIEVVGRNIRLLIPPELKEEQYGIIAGVYEGRRVKHYEAVYVNKEGDYIDINITVSPIRDTAEHIIGASLVAQDMTQQKIIAANLQNYLGELEISNRDLQAFSHIASHDLKEPLRGLSYLSSILLEDYKDKLDADGAKLLTQLGANCVRMEDLISNLLYFSELENEKSAIQEADPNEMLGEIQQLMEFFLKEKNARIVVPHPLPRVVCDKVRITEVFRNLITNAIKHNDKEEPIVEVGFLESVKTEKGGEKNVFYVSDNGVGIAPKNHRLIFTMFKKIPSPAGNGKNGSGVGLTFTKKIIERHNGRIWLESEPGKGSTFYFTIGKR